MGKPSEILRTKKDSSIQVACRLVKQGKADAIVSAGHSGAAVACGMFILGRIPGVERPALATILPTEKNLFFCLMWERMSNAVPIIFSSLPDGVDLCAGSPGV